MITGSIKSLAELCWNMKMGQFFALAPLHQECEHAFGDADASAIVAVIEAIKRSAAA